MRVLLLLYHYVPQSVFNLLDHATHNRARFDTRCSHTVVQYRAVIYLFLTDGLEKQRSAAIFGIMNDPYLKKATYFIIEHNAHVEWLIVCWMSPYSFVVPSLIFYFRARRERSRIEESGEDKVRVYVCTCVHAHSTHSL